MDVRFRSLDRWPIESTPKELYRRAAKATHPDHGGDAARFREVQAAADALGLS